MWTGRRRRRRRTSEQLLDRQAGEPADKKHRMFRRWSSTGAVLAAGCVAGRVLGVWGSSPLAGAGRGGGGGRADADPWCTLAAPDAATPPPPPAARSCPASAMADTKPGTWKTLLSMRVGRDPNLSASTPPVPHGQRPASPPPPSHSYTAYSHSAPVVPTHSLHPLESRPRMRAARGHTQAHIRKQPTAISPLLVSATNPIPNLTSSPASPSASPSKTAAPRTPRTPSPRTAHSLHRRDSARDSARKSAPRPALAPDDHRPRRPPQTRRTPHPRPVDTLPSLPRSLRSRQHAQRPSPPPRATPEHSGADGTHAHPSV